MIINKVKTRGDVLNYIVLWKSVVIQAIVDYYSLPEEKERGKKEKIDSKKRQDLYCKNEAKKFLNSKYFDTICTLAELDTKWVLKNKRKIFLRSLGNKKDRYFKKSNNYVDY